MYDFVKIDNEDILYFHYINSDAVTLSVKLI